MSETIQNEERSSPPTKSSGKIATWYRKFHFSGRVIMCSVLFGFGLILIGGIVFAINADSDSPKSEYGSNDEISTKAPSNVVGPVVMSIGSFIVIVGIVMCLFETQVCRKKTGDSSPLISEKVSHGKDSESMPSTSNAQSGHRHGARNTAASSKRSKGRHVKSRSKDRVERKTPSPRSPAITINTSKNFMTSSEDKFLTPPNTLTAHPNLYHNTSQDTKNQTSSSLMKSVTSSENQSTEFQTPFTSLENSVEVGENQERWSMNTSKLHKLNISSGFLTPVTLEEEKLQEIADKIRNQKDKSSNAQYIKEIGSYLNNSYSDKFPDINNSSECGTNLENMDKKSVIEIESTVKDNQKCEINKNKIMLIQQPLLNTSQYESLIKESHQKQGTEAINPHGTQDKDKGIYEETSTNTANEKTITEKSLPTFAKLKTIQENSHTEESNSSEEFSNDVSELNKNKKDESTIEVVNLTSKSNELTSEADNLTSEVKKVTSEAEKLTNETEKLASVADKLSNEVDRTTYKIENDESDEQFDLESSVSSSETVISRQSLPENRGNTNESKESDLESQKKLEEGAVNLNKDEYEISALLTLNDEVDVLKSQTSMAVNEEVPPQFIESQSKNIEMSGSSENFSTANSS